MFSVDFFSKLTFSKHISVPVSNSLESDWIWVQTVCKDLQQAIKIFAAKT